MTADRGQPLGTGSCKNVKLKRNLRKVSLANSPHEKEGMIGREMRAVVKTAWVSGPWNKSEETSGEGGCYLQDFQPEEGAGVA